MIRWETTARCRTQSPQSTGQTRVRSPHPLLRPGRRTSWWGRMLFQAGPTAAPRTPCRSHLTSKASTSRLIAQGAWSAKNWPSRSRNSLVWKAFPRSTTTRTRSTRYRMMMSSKPCKSLPRRLFYALTRSNWFCLSLSRRFIQNLTSRILSRPCLRRIKRQTVWKTVRRDSLFASTSHWVPRRSRLFRKSTTPRQAGAPVLGKGITRILWRTPELVILRRFKGINIKRSPNCWT